uniref:Uncharacterized protein n=1 Tax=Plectus sambesii TaxID=2011161 RepID=A0A914WKI4_9BILA
MLPATPHGAHFARVVAVIVEVGQSRVQQVARLRQTHVSWDMSANDVVATNTLIAYVGRSITAAGGARADEGNRRAAGGGSSRRTKSVDERSDQSGRNSGTGVLGRRAIDVLALVAKTKVVVAKRRHRASGG